MESGELFQMRPMHRRRKAVPLDILWGSPPCLQLPEDMDVPEVLHRISQLHATDRVTTLDVHA